MPTPLIGITVDNKDNTATSGRYESSIAYSRGIAQAGGVPLLLPHELGLAEHYVDLCDGIMLTGGADPRMERFGEAMHAQASPVDSRRQEFELALLAALDRTAGKPALGVCLGMQFMALHAGGKLNQHLPDVLPEAQSLHRHNARHAVNVIARDSVMMCDPDGMGMAGANVEASSSSPTATTTSEGIPGEDYTVISSHHQAVESPGLRTVALSPEGVIEAIDDPRRAFYLGVQWHPERGGEGQLNLDLLKRFVFACRAARA